jgi:phage-related protein
LPGVQKGTEKMHCSSREAPGMSVENCSFRSTTQRLRTSPCGHSSTVGIGIETGTIEWSRTLSGQMRLTFFSSSREPTAVTPNPSLKGRSNGVPPSPGHRARSLIFCGPGLASHRWPPLSSNVRQHKSHSSCKTITCLLSCRRGIHDPVLQRERRRRHPQAPRHSRRALHRAHAENDRNWPKSWGAAYKAFGTGLFELRLKGAEGIARVFFCTLVGRRIVMLHSFIKKSAKTPLREVEVAEARLKEVKRANT